MADGPLRRLFWRVADDLDYLVTLARRRIMDALAGPEPETPADQQRARDRERIEKAFPETEREQPNAVISHRTDRVPTEDCLPSFGRGTRREGRTSVAVPTICGSWISPQTRHRSRPSIIAGKPLKRARQPRGRQREPSRIGCTAWLAISIGWPMPLTTLSKQQMRRPG